jgi:hypothetical protein
VISEQWPEERKNFSHRARRGTEKRENNRIFAKLAVKSKSLISY